MLNFTFLQPADESLERKASKPCCLPRLSTNCLNKKAVSPTWPWPKELFQRLNTYSLNLLCQAATMGTLPWPSVIELQRDLLCAFRLFSAKRDLYRSYRRTVLRGDGFHRIMISGNFHKYRCIYSPCGFKLLNYVPFFRVLTSIKLL